MAATRDTLSGPALAGALAAILLLAIALPFGAVSALHVGRLERADVDLGRIARYLGEQPSLPAGVVVFSTGGDMPRFDDAAWMARASGRLEAGVPGPDPWGNAYLVVAANAGGGVLWVLSAGADGIVQTSLQAIAAGPKGDDRGRRVGVVTP